MGSTTKAIQESIDGGALGGYKEFEALHTTLPSIMGMLAGAGVNLDMDNTLDGMITTNGRVRGRSGGTVTADEEEEAVPVSMLGAGEKEYVRPNGDKYYPRFWGEHKDVLVIRKARETMQFVLSYGVPGCGKTALFEAAFSTGMHTLIGSGDTEVADFVGSYVQRVFNGRVEYVWIDGPLIRAMENGEVFMIDEIGLIDPKVMSILYGIMDGRREYNLTQNPERGVITAKDGFFIVAATNPHAPGVRLSEALLSRFPLQVEMTTDWGLAKSMGVPSKIVQAAQNMVKKRDEGMLRWTPQMRELLAYRDLAKVFGEKFAVANLIAGAPEEDRIQVADVFSRIFADDSITSARI